MSGFVDHVAAALSRTVSEGLLLFGGVFALAVALWFASQLLRGYGSGLLGRRYWWIVAPGVACHETGHALGCVLTRTKILEYVPFRPEGDTLGYVVHEERPGVWPRIAEFFISTGPVWFGCAVVLLLARLFAGPDFLPSFDALAPRPGEPASVHLKGVWYGALWMFRTLLAPWRWRTPLFPVFLYLVFCVASEITLSPSDLKGTWRGLAALAGLLFAVNLVPGASVALARERFALLHATTTKNTARTASEAVRALLKPDEVRRLPRETTLLFAQGVAPVACRRLSYFSDPAFAGRFDPTPHHRA